MMVCGSLMLMGESCGDSPDGDGGSGGDPGTGGDAGMGGTAGSGGSGGMGGSSASNDCGYLTTCNPDDPTCDDYCDGLCDGGQDDVEASDCRDDGRCWCWCATGICSQDDCITSEPCLFDDPDESFCENECAQICSGEDDIREAYCDGPGVITGYCRCICKVGGNVSCVEGS